jgi:outer membrane protein assembly factor BamB
MMFLTVVKVGDTCNNPPQLGLEQVTMKKIFLALVSLSMIVSCRFSTNTPLGETNFPLEKVAEILIEENIEEVAVGETWIAVATGDSISGFDIETQEQLWSIDFSVMTYSDPSFRMVNDTLIAASPDQLLVIEKVGTARQIDLNPEGKTILHLSAANSNYVYIIRGSRWMLEAYDFTRNKLLWTTLVDRGGRDAFYNKSKDIVYVPTSNNSILAVDNSTGELLWKKDGHVWHSVFEEEILYTFEEMDGRNSFRFAAIDVTNQEELWRKDIVLLPTKIVENMAIVNDSLVVGTGAGLLALNKFTGEQIWNILKEDEFDTRVIEFDSLLFVKGSSRTVYAIDPNDGTVIGSVKLENSSSAQKNYEVYAGVHKLRDGILFYTKQTLIIYK